MKRRMNELRKRINENRAQGFLIFSLPNIRYLIGYTGSNGLLFVGERAVFVTDFRYEEQAKKEVESAMVLITKSPLFERLTKSTGFKKVKNILFEAKHISYEDFMDIRKKTRDKKWKASKGIVEGMREVKEEEEIKKIKKACEITISVFEEVLKLLRPGIKENDIAAEIDYQMKKKGADKPSFDTIVVSGEKSAMPHGKPGERRLKKGDFVTLDFGAVYKGYHADFTRTVVIGKASKKQKKIYEIVKKAQEEAINRIKPGMLCKEADSIAREVIKKEGYGKYFGHSLGHGVGLEIHELPRLSFLSNSKIRENSVVTIEPGVYLPDFGGVRIEDTVVVRKNGIEVLTKFTKELIEI